ncbi:putative inactive receptor kinase At5g10020 [Silene latifolia]|uniref:putative inactive receptor kinase At5g10020 n=1 Tax=Silene latifolia TaxID=37657 RepID=UPI003D77A782
MSTTSSTVTSLTLNLIFILVFLSPPSPATAYSGEVQALLEFKKGIRHDPTGQIVDSWNSAAVSTAGDLDLCPDAFHGVACDETSNAVVSIVLDRLNLQGDLKFSTLVPLKYLRNLSLSGNSFTGRLVPQLGSISSLQYLDLSFNYFIGRVPDRIHDLWNLQYLNLSNNQFSGGYPSGIGNLQQLRVIDLSRNELWGNVGVLFSEMRNVEFVDLSCNNFSGGLPVDVANVSSLGNTVRHLNLSRNLLGGRFLSNDTLALFKSLEVLDVGDNFINGELPSFGGVFNLKVLRVPNNQLFGQIPVELLTNLVPLTELDLSGNGFSGSVQGINSTTLEILELSSNSLTGSFPEFSSQTALTTLRISNNRLVGNLPSEWTQFPRLSKVDLSINNFTGPIPPALFSLKLMHLNFSRNHFNGAIRFPKSKLSDFLVQPVFAPLEVLDLSDNSLEGGLSKEIDSLGGLKILNLAKNSLSGHIPDSLDNIKGLESLDLSDNQFEGHLPNTLPSSLKTLNVTYNGLSGDLPESLRRFPQSSFHPGNEKLNLPTVGPGNNGSSSFPDDKRHGSKGNIRVAIILASIGATLMIVFVLIAYYRAQFHTFPGRTNFDGGTSERDAKFGIFTRPARFKFHGGSQPPQTSLSFSNDHLLTSTSRTLSGPAENVTVIVDRAPATVGSNTSSMDPILPDNAVVTSPPASPLSSSLRFFEGSERPVTLDVYSPDRFAGELFFLDTSLSFTAEQLSRAPAEVLGRSSHGTLYKATLDGGLMLTVKWLRVGLVKNKKEFSKEAKKIGSMRHSHLVPVRAYYWGPKEQERLILSDYVHGDSLALHLYESTPRRHSSLSFNHRLQVAVDVARCLVFLHDKGMPHGDLKPTNILLVGPDFNARVTDFGLHRLMTPAGIAEHILNLGALGYCAPELVNASKPVLTLKADVYALGVILMELLTRRSAGDIISGQSGAVDLTDWVRLCDREGRRMDCVDRDIARGEESSRAMDDMLVISLRCILPVNERPNIRQVFEDLCSISG